MKKPTIAALLVFLGISGCVSPQRMQTGRLEFDVLPCAGEIHISLSSVAFVAADGTRVENPDFRAPPTVTYTANGKTAVLGTFCPGCSDALRLHEPPPDVQGDWLDITIRGVLRTGETVSGSQRINLDEF